MIYKWIVVVGKKYQKKSVDFMFLVCYYKKAFGEKNSLKKIIKKI